MESTLPRMIKPHSPDCIHSPTNLTVPFLLLRRFLYLVRLLYPPLAWWTLGTRKRSWSRSPRSLSLPHMHQLSADSLSHHRQNLTCSHDTMAPSSMIGVIIILKT